MAAKARFIAGNPTIISLMIQDNSLDRVKGQWRLSSCITEKKGSTEKFKPLGERPKGRLVITETAYLLVLITTSQRAIATSEADKSAAYSTMVSYSGCCEFSGNQLTTKVDISWNEEWVGGEQVRYFEFSGETLMLTTAWEANPWEPETSSSTPIRSVLAWEREA